MWGIDFALIARLIFLSVPLWLTILLISVFFQTWLNYKRRKFIREKGSGLLEVRLPKDPQNAPAAMEMVLEGMWEDVPGTTTDVYMDGAVRNWYSLELVSIGGDVKFYIWTWPSWRPIVENRLYAQYPGVEIHEAKDYALDIIHDPTKTKIGGLMSTALMKEDVIPIKTYIDFGLDKTDKEPEQIIDPLVPILESLGSRKPGEIAAFQILIQGHRGQTLLKDALINPQGHFSQEVKTAVEKIANGSAYFKGKKDDPPSILNLTKTQTEAIASIERNAGKHAYDTMIRILYAAPLEIADKMSTAGLIGSMRQFQYVGKNHLLNGIRPAKFLGYEFSWQDPFSIKSNREKREHLDAYKRRSFFNVPYKHLTRKPYVLTVEELATLFHFPAGATATTPSLLRIPSKKAEAPANLPI